MPARPSSSLFWNLYAGRVRPVSAKLAPAFLRARLCRAFHPAGRLAEVRAFANHRACTPCGRASRPAGNHPFCNPIPAVNGLLAAASGRAGNGAMPQTADVKRGILRGWSATGMRQEPPQRGHVMQLPLECFLIMSEVAELKCGGDPACPPRPNGVFDVHAQRSVFLWCREY